MSISTAAHHAYHAGRRAQARAALWLFGTVVFGLAVYYFIGVDQGATSVFGNNMDIHEFTTTPGTSSVSPATRPAQPEEYAVERRFILRGLLVGAFGGILAFVFARIFAEPQIQAAIDYESGRDAAQALLDKAAGLHRRGGRPRPVQPDDPGQRRHRRRDHRVRRGDGRPVRGRLHPGLRPYRQPAARGRWRCWSRSAGSWACTWSRSSSTRPTRRRSAMRRPSATAAGCTC